MIEHLAARIGQIYTEADHAAVIAHVAEISRLAEAVAALREREPVVKNRGQIRLEFERAAELRRALILDLADRPVHHHSLIDPEAAEI